MLLRNGRVISPVAPRATALLVDDVGAIAWVGGRPAEVEQPGVRTVDLNGAFLAPAFVDAHVHATSTGLALTGLDLRHARSLGEALDAIEAAARTGRGR